MAAQRIIVVDDDHNLRLALKYRLEDDGSFTIWSVGHNLVDDGGKIEKVESLWKADDYVWNSRLLRGSE